MDDQCFSGSYRQSGLFILRILGQLVTFSFAPSLDLAYAGTGTSQCFFRQLFLLTLNMLSIFPPIFLFLLHFPVCSGFSIFWQWWGFVFSPLPIQNRRVALYNYFSLLPGKGATVVLGVRGFSPCADFLSPLNFFISQLQVRMGAVTLASHILFHLSHQYLLRFI